MSRQSCTVSVIVNSASRFFPDFIRYIRPYLVHFGFPFREIDRFGAKKAEETGDPAPSLVVLGHDGLELERDGPRWGEYFARVLEEGGGILSFDTIRVLPLPGETLSDSAAEPIQSGTIEIDPSHYITALHAGNETVRVRGELSISRVSAFEGAGIPARAGSRPLLTTAKVGNGRVAVWSSYGWMAPSILGPFAGVDDLVWRSLVWISRKPCIMQGMPPLVTMRVDDVWGSPKSGRSDDPLYWVGIANKSGVKPWLGLFLDNMDEPAVASCRRYVTGGNATAFPHAFAGYDRSTGSGIQEDSIYFDHWRKQDCGNAVLAENLRRTRDWHHRNAIPISKVALAHYYEIGTNALEEIVNWGCETVGAHMAPGQPYRSATGYSAWLPCGPFRNYVSGNRTDALPCYYADYLRLEEMPKFSGRLFNCLTEIRDISGYEWAPSNYVSKTIRDGVAQVRRAFDSMALASLFTHESDYLQHITPRNWETIMAGVCKEIDGYRPRFATLDDACGYVRAKHDTVIRSATCEKRVMLLRLSGNASVPTQAYVFLQDGNEISSRLVDIPPSAEISEACISV